MFRYIMLILFDWLYKTKLKFHDWQLQSADNLGAS